MRRRLSKNKKKFGVSVGTRSPDVCTKTSDQHKRTLDGFVIVFREVFGGVSSSAENNSSS